MTTIAGTPRTPGRAVVLAMVGLFAAVGLAVSRRDGTTDHAARTSPRPTTFPVVELLPDEVHRIGIESGGSGVALVHATAGTWLAEPGTPGPAVALMTELEDQVFPLLAYRRLEVRPSPEFGLSTPELVVRIEGHTGHQVVVSVGGPTFSGGGLYAERDGDGRVYLLARRSVDHLRSLVRGERVDTPRSPEEITALEEAERFEDPEEVTNPWLAQVIEEVPE